MFGGLDVQSPLVNNLRDADPNVRKAAAFGLRHLGRALKEGGGATADYDVRREAIRGTASELFKLLNDPNAAVRAEVTNALQVIAPSLLYKLGG